MNLPRGILEFNGIDVAPRTTQSEFEALFPSSLFRINTSPLHPERVSYTNISTVKFDDMLARVHVFFNESVIQNVEVICIEERFRNPTGNWSNEKYDQKREYHKKWLLDKLGQPTFQNKWVTSYSFDWGTISSESDPRDPTLAIVIRYGNVV